MEHRGVHGRQQGARGHGHLHPVERRRSVRLFLGDRWTPWNVDDSWFRPFDARFREVRPDSQIWVRRNAQSPWILDVPFTRDTQGRWTNKRNPEHTEDLEAVTWIAPDGLRYARAEVTLMFKAAQAREKDRRDAEVALPMLHDASRVAP